jgi:hypothetical protein
LGEEICVSAGPGNKIKGIFLLQDYPAGLWIEGGGERFERRSPLIERII